MEDKLLTFIVPAYNVEKYIGDCLESLLHQTVCCHKVIIIDDGSKDQTGNICQEYVRKYPDLFRYIRTVNHGLGYARNIGMAGVKTKYMTFLDSDDWLDLNYVEVVVRELEKFPGENIDMIYTMPVIYNAVTGLFYDWHDKELFEEIFYGSSRIVSACSNSKMYELEYSFNRRIIRTDYARQIGFQFEVGVKWEDVYPHFFITYHAGKCLGIKEVGFNYRINTGNQITGTTGAGRLDMVNAFAKTWHFFIQKDVSKEIRNVAFNQMTEFAKWSMAASSREVSGILVDRLRELMHILPNKYVRDYKKSFYPRFNRWFIMGIRVPGLKRLYSDYFLRRKVLGFIRKAGW